VVRATNTPRSAATAPPVDSAPAAERAQRTRHPRSIPDRTRRPRDARGLLAPPRSASGAVLGAVSFAASVVPSLLPRSWLVQGVLSGVAVAVGYLFGVVLGRLARAVGPRPPPRVARGAAIVLGVLAVGTAVWSLVVYVRWQSDVRSLMGIAPAGWYHPVAVVALAALTAASLLLVARTLALGHRLYRQAVDTRLPRRARTPVRVAIAVLVGVFLLDVALGDWAFTALRSSFATADARYEHDVERPRSSLRSGGPGSALDWDELGRMGRAFAGGGPTTRELTAFAGAPATPPIRVYVGLDAAPSARQRADLALAELERTGAFDRQALVLVTPTGTGWVDPQAVDSLEYLYAGDTAMAAVQYSYMPSWVTMMGNQDRARQGARAVFTAVSEHLDTLPASERPQLLLYGQSLGAFGSEQIFDQLEEINGRVDGVLWAGPPSASRLWRRGVAARERDTPVWEPVYDAGRTVRFGADGAALARPGPNWERPRVVYLQNATDPISWWRPRLLRQRPEWLNEPRGPGVSEEMPFVPLVTGFQVGLDLLQSLAVPPGHGHVFGPAHAEAWALIAPPPDWSPGDTSRLRTVMTAELDP
jgi:uncharacterized membrane protein